MNRMAHDPTAIRFLRSLEAGDFDDVEHCLAPDVWMRALLPNSTIELNSREDVSAKLRYWFEETAECEPVDSAVHSLGTREHLRYCFQVRPSLDSPDRYLVEQLAYLRIREGLVSRLDLVCSGYHKLPAVDQERVAS